MYSVCPYVSCASLKLISLPYLTLISLVSTNSKTPSPMIRYTRAYQSAYKNAEAWVVVYVKFEACDSREKSLDSREGPCCIH